MKISKKIYLSILTLCSFIVLWIGTIPIKVTADQNTGTSFVISGNMPSNQQSDSGYFDLLVEPSDEQQLEVVITNVTNQDIEVEIDLADATTTNNGSVNYQLDKTLEKDSSLEIAFTDMARLEETRYKIPANSSIVVPVHLKISSTPFLGVVLGGITATQVIEETTSDNRDTKGTSTGIQNVYSYSIAAMLYESEEEVAPSLSLNEVYAGQRNYRNYIQVNLQNISPRIIQDLTIDAEIYDSKNQLAYTSSAERFKMAPNSNFDYGIDLKETKFIAGEYNLFIKVIADGIEFTFEKEFIITEDDARKNNESAILIEQELENKWLIYLIILLILSVISLIAWVLYKKSKRDSSKSE